MIGLTNLRVDRTLLHLALGKGTCRARGVTACLGQRAEMPYPHRICSKERRIHERCARNRIVAGLTHPT